MPLEYLEQARDLHILRNITGPRWSAVLAYMIHAQSFLVSPAAGATTILWSPSRNAFYRWGVGESFFQESEDLYNIVRRITTLLPVEIAYQHALWDFSELKNVKEMLLPFKAARNPCEPADW